MLIFLLWEWLWCHLESVLLFVGNGGVWLSGKVFSWLRSWLPDEVWRVPQKRVAVIPSGLQFFLFRNPQCGQSLSKVTA